MWRIGREQLLGFVRKRFLGFFAVKLWLCLMFGRSGLENWCRSVGGEVRWMIRTTGMHGMIMR